MLRRVQGQWLTMINPNVLAVIGLYCCVWLVLWAGSHYWVQSQVVDGLRTQMPQAVELAMVNAHNQQQMLSYIQRQLGANAQLQLIHPAPWAMVWPTHLSAVDVSFVSQDAPADLRWQYADKTLGVRYRLESHSNGTAISVYALLICLLAWAAYRSLPQRQPAEVKQWQRLFNEAGLTPQQQAPLLQQVITQPKVAAIARELTNDCGQTYPQSFAIAASDDLAGLTSEQMRWFKLALNHELSFAQALAVARAPAELKIDLINSRVTIHGLTIDFAKTPLFYFYWYAQRQRQNQGLYLNPAQSKPDLAQGLLLADIMEAHQGHRRAINDLREHGLKSKTLDQNRNKIKEELHSVLGDLAGPYLFAGQRDGRSARYAYGLQLPPDRIHL